MAGIIDTVLAEVRSITSGFNLQTGILSGFGGFGGQGVLSQRVSFFNSRINAAKTQSVPVEKVKAFMNPITPSFVPKVIMPNGVLAKAGISMPSFAPTGVSLPVAVAPPSKQVISVPTPLVPQPISMGNTPLIFR